MPTIGTVHNARGRARRWDSTTAAIRNSGTTSSCGRIASVPGSVMHTRNGTNVTRTAVIGCAPRAFVRRYVTPTAPPTIAARATTSPRQPPTPWIPARRSCAPHCWLCQGAPAMVKVKGSSVAPRAVAT